MTADELLAAASAFAGRPVRKLALLTEGGERVRLDAPRLGPRPQPPSRGGDVRDCILAAATDAPRIGKSLARLAGYKYNSNFRSALAALTRQGRLKHTPDGYALAAAPAPGRPPLQLAAGAP